MKQLIWSLIGFGLLIWSGVMWLLFELAGAGEAAVVSVTRWLALDMGTTQWLADGLALAGGIAQFLVGAIWLMGAAVGLLIGGILARGADSMAQLQRNQRFSVQEQSVEAEVLDKKIF